MTQDSLAHAKQIVWRFLETFPSPRQSRQQLDPLISDTCEWHVGHPVERLEGQTAVWSRFYEPLLQAFPDVERRTDIFLAGHWDGHLDGGEGIWVSVTGHYVGTFFRNWLGVPATGSVAALRFGEFYRVDGGRIAEARILLDVIGLMRQAAMHVLPPSRGVEILIPGPADHTGILRDPQPAEETAASMNLVMAMIGGLGRYDRADLRSMAMENFWRRDMMWYGPCGIGTTRGIGGFQLHHQQPFLTAFPDRQGGNHRARLAEGNYVATTGWPSVRATHAGEYLGAPARGTPINMRVMDWWRRKDGLLVENWVFIDLPHLFLQMGVDLLAGIARRP